MKKYIKLHWKQLLFSILFALFASLFGVIVQFIKGDVLDNALIGNAQETIKFGFLLGILIILELLAFYKYDIAKAKFAIGAMINLRADYFKSITNKTYPDFLDRNQGEYLASYTNNMEIVENQYLSTIPMLFEILIKILLVSISLFLLSPKIAIITLLLLTMPLYVPKLVEKKLQQAQMNYVKQFEHHIKAITDWLRGFEIIKNFSIENKILDLFKASNKRTQQMNYVKKRMGYITRSISAILSYSSHFIILIFSAYLVLNKEFTAGEFFVAMGMIDQLSYPIISLSYFIQDLISSKPVYLALLKEIDYTVSTSSNQHLDPTKFENVTFNNISFGYTDNEILTNLNLSFSVNNNYLIRGKSGSGKTTVINLLLKYYQPKTGTISVNDMSLNDLGNLNDIITVMRQDAILFEDTLRNNLTMYQEYNDNHLFEILNSVGLDVYANSESLDMMINENGTNLSGGERRRITLARSLLRDTPILILDEPLANLDDLNAQSIESYLLNIKNRLVIVISHQFSPEKMIEFDQIYRLDAS